MSTEETDFNPTPKFRKMPQYVTDQLLLAIDNVRAGRMHRTDMAFAAYTIKIYRVADLVRIDLQEKPEEGK